MRERERYTPSLPAWWYYLDEVLHIAVKQPMVIHGAGSRLPHFLWFRGEGGGPGKRWTKGRDSITLGTDKPWLQGQNKHRCEEKRPISVGGFWWRCLEVVALMNQSKHVNRLYRKSLVYIRHESHF